MQNSGYRPRPILVVVRRELFHNRGRNSESAPLAQGFSEIVYPGELEARNDAKNRVTGLILPDDTIADLRKTGAENGVSAEQIWS